MALCTICGEHPQSTRKTVTKGRCCNKCPNHGPWCTMHDRVMPCAPQPTTPSDETVAEPRRRAPRASSAPIRAPRASKSAQDHDVEAPPPAPRVSKPRGPKGTKRSAPAAAATVTKRLVGVSAKCETVVAALNNLDGYSFSCKEMLATMARSSLDVLAADRHSCQVKAVQILKDAMEDLEKQMHSAVAEAQVKMDQANEEALGDNLLEQGEALLAELSEKAEAAKENV